MEKRLYIVNAKPIVPEEYLDAYKMSFYEFNIKDALFIANFYRQMGCIITIKSKVVEVA